MAEPTGGGQGLEVRDVTVAFGGLIALDQVSIDVQPGEVVGIIGPNGAGKTTLFNVVCGFVRSATGTVRYDGAPLPRGPDRRARLGIARTLQGLGLWPGMTVLENVMAGATIHERAGFVAAMLGLSRSAHDERSLAERARHALAEVGLAGVDGRLPRTLPHAVQKQVVLARALVGEPRLLLLDEPASGLSSVEMADLGKEIRGLSQRMGVALVEHHMDLVMSVCDRVVVLELGRVIASGTPAEVQNDPAVTTAYLGEAARESPESVLGA